MLNFSIDAHRGTFHLQLECHLPAGWTVIFGPSGAGKSTLLRLLAGLDRPDTGRITLDGNVFTDTGRGIYLTPRDRRTAFVTQKSALFPQMTVSENVAYGVAYLDRPSRNSRVAEMLDLVDASALAQRQPGALSGGEAQRVALARALATGPRLLLLDEPFSALDGTASDALLARLQTWLRQHNVQTVLATHDATDAFATSAEVALIHEGRLVALGPTAQALSAERNRILDLLKPSSSIET
ncbi:MAG: ATP-binding cassette domain-containing protein [Terracidiphilus sp.]